MAKVTGKDEGLKRLGGGRWQTRDERFTIEPQSGTWVLVDAEQTDDLGLPLVRGPFSGQRHVFSGPETRERGPSMTDDVRMRGFRARAELAEALALLRPTAALAGEDVSISECAGAYSARSIRASTRRSGDGCGSVAVPVCTSRASSMDGTTCSVVTDSRMIRSLR